MFKDYETPEVEVTEMMASAVLCQSEYGAGTEDFTIEDF